MKKLQVLDRIKDNDWNNQDDAERWRFLAAHWNSLMGGIPLHKWIDAHALARGGVAAALDYAMGHHYGGERHIAEASEPNRKEES